MPNPRKQKITTNNFTKTKQEEKQTDRMKNKTKWKRKRKMQCWLEWQSATSYRAYNSGNCDCPLY